MLQGLSLPLLLRFQPYPSLCPCLYTDCLKFFLPLIPMLMMYTGWLFLAIPLGTGTLQWKLYSIPSLPMWKMSRLHQSVVERQLLNSLILLSKVKLSPTHIFGESINCSTTFAIEVRSGQVGFSLPNMEALFWLTQIKVQVSQSGSGSRKITN